MFNGYNEASPIYNDCDHDRAKKHLNVGKWPQGHGAGLQPHVSNHPEFSKPFLKYPNVLPVPAKCNCAECYPCPENQSLQTDPTRHRPWFGETSKLADYHHQWDNVGLTEEKSCSLEETSSRYLQENGEKSSFHRPYAAPRQSGVIASGKKDETATGPSAQEILLLGQNKARQTGHYGNGIYENKKESASSDANCVSDYERFPNSSSYASNQNALLHQVPSNATQNRVPSIGHRPFKGTSDSFLDQNFHDPGKILQSFDESRTCRNVFQGTESKAMSDPRQDLQNGHANHLYADPKPAGPYADYSGYNPKRDYLASCYEAESQKIQYYNKKNELLGRNYFPEPVKKNVTNVYADSKRDCMMSSNGSVPLHEQYYGTAKFWETGNPKVNSCGVYYPKEAEKRSRGEPKTTSVGEPSDCSQRGDASGKRELSNQAVTRAPTYPASYPADPNGLRYSEKDYVHPFYYQSNPAAYKSLRRPEYPYPRYNAQARYDYPPAMTAFQNSAQYNLKTYQPPPACAGIDQYLPHVNNNLVYDSSYQQPGLHAKTIPQPFYDAARSDLQMQQHYPSDFGTDLLLARKQQDRYETSKMDLATRSSNNKISPLRLLRKKKTNLGSETEGAASEQSLETVQATDGAQVLDVRKFWATFTDEEEDNNNNNNNALQPPQMIVLNYENIGPEQAELLRLCDGQTVHVDGTGILTISEPCAVKNGEQPRLRTTADGSETRTDRPEEANANVDARPKNLETVKETIPRKTTPPVESRTLSELPETGEANREPLSKSPEKPRKDVDKWTEKKFDFVKKAEETKAAEALRSEEEKKIIMESTRLYKHIAFGNRIDAPLKDDNAEKVREEQKPEENKTVPGPAESEEEKTEERVRPDESFSNAEDSLDGSKSVENMPTLTELPTSEYRKNKFLDYSGAETVLKAVRKAPELESPEKAKESVTEKMGSTDSESKPRTTDPVTQDELDEISRKISRICFDCSDGVDENEVKGAKHKKAKKSPKKNKKFNGQENGSDEEPATNLSTTNPKLKFSIQKLQDLKMSFKILNDSNTRENIALDDRDSTIEKVDKKESEQMDSRLKPDEDFRDVVRSENDKNPEKIVRRSKKKKVRSKTPTLKIKKIRFPDSENETEESDAITNVLDLSKKEAKTPEGFRVHEVVDSAKIKLTFKREAIASEKENVDRFKSRKKTSGFSSAKRKPRRCDNSQQFDCEGSEIDATPDAENDKSKTDISSDPIGKEGSFPICSDEIVPLRVPTGDEAEPMPERDGPDFEPIDFTETEEGGKRETETVAEETEPSDGSGCIVETDENLEEKETEGRDPLGRKAAEIAPSPPPETDSVGKENSCETEERRTVIRHSLEENLCLAEELVKNSASVNRDLESTVTETDSTGNRLESEETEPSDVRDLEPSEKVTLEQELTVSSDEEIDSETPEIVNAEPVPETPDYNLIESQLVEIFRHSSDDEKEDANKANFKNDNPLEDRDVIESAEAEVALLLLSDAENAVRENKGDCEREKSPSENEEKNISEEPVKDSVESNVLPVFEEVTDLVENFRPDVDENIEESAGSSLMIVEEEEEIVERSTDLHESESARESSSVVKCPTEAFEDEEDDLTSRKTEEANDGKPEESRLTVDEKTIEDGHVDEAENSVSIETVCEEVFSESLEIVSDEKEVGDAPSEIEKISYQAEAEKSKTVPAGEISLYLSVVPAVKKMRTGRSRSLSKELEIDIRRAKASSLPPDTKFDLAVEEADEKCVSEIPISDIPLPEGDAPKENRFDFELYFERTKESEAGNSPEETTGLPTIGPEKPNETEIDEKDVEETRQPDPSSDAENANRSPSPGLSDVSSESAFSGSENWENCRSPFVLSGFQKFRNPSPPCETENFQDKFDISTPGELFLKHPRVDSIQKDSKSRNPSPPSLKFSTDSPLSTDSKTDSDGFSFSRHSEEDEESSKEKFSCAEESSSPISYSRFVTSPEKVSREIFDFSPQETTSKKDSPIRTEKMASPSHCENLEDGKTSSPIAIEKDSPKNEETIQIECYDENVCDSLVTFEDAIFVEEGLYECEEPVATDSLPVAVDEVEEEKVSDDKFHDVMQNCLENAKKFLNVGHLKLLSCSVEDLLEIESTEKTDSATKVASEDHISRDVLLTSFEDGTKDELALAEDLPPSDLSVDFVPSFGMDSSRDDLCPEILPVDNWPYLEEEVPSSPTKSKNDEPDVSSPPLEDAPSSENPVCTFDPLKNVPDSQNVIPFYLGDKKIFFQKRETDENGNPVATESNGFRRRSLVAEIRTMPAEVSSSRRRKTVDGVARPKVPRRKSTEGSPDDSQRKKEPKKVDAEEGTKRCPPKRDCVKKDGEGKARVERSLSKRTGKEPENGFLSRKWQPKVVLSRISEKILKEKKRTKPEKNESDAPKKKPRTESGRIRNGEIPSEKSAGDTALLLKIHAETPTQKEQEKEKVPNGFSKNGKRKRSAESDETPKTTDRSSENFGENKRRKPRFRNLHSKNKLSESDSDSERRPTNEVDVSRERITNSKGKTSPTDSDPPKTEESRTPISESKNVKKSVPETSKRSDKTDSERHAKKETNSRNRCQIPQVKSKEVREDAHNRKRKETKEDLHPREEGKKKISESNNVAQEKKKKKKTKTETESQVWVCQVCGFHDSAERSLHIQTHAFHCQSCHLAFKTESYFIEHLTKKHKDIKSQHHCLLCESSFDTEEEHRNHLDSREHKHLESVEKNTINTLLTLLTGQSCPIFGPVENKPEWLPNRAGTVHFYHQATPLSLALQYLKIRHDNSSSRSRRPSDNHTPSIS